MSLSPCCNAEYGEYGSMSHSFTACSKCGKSEFSIEIDKLRAERDEALKAYSMECEETEKELDKLREENEHFRITINAENDRLSRNETLEKENKRLQSLCLIQAAVLKGIAVYGDNATADHILKVVDALLTARLGGCEDDTRRPS